MAYTAILFDLIHQILIQFNKPRELVISGPHRGVS